MLKSEFPHRHETTTVRGWKLDVQYWIFLLFFTVSCILSAGMNLVLIDKTELDDNGTARIDGRRGRHVLEILKVEPGQKIRVGMINGPRGEGIVLETGNDHIVLKVELNSHIPDRPRTDILLALPRPLVMKRLWSVLPTVGVGRIILTNASKVERFYFDTHWLTKEHYEPLIIEGLEQAGDTLMPAVTVHRHFKRMLEDDLNKMFPEGKKIVGHPGAETPMGNIQVEQNERVLMAVGPEGGWTDQELELLKDHGFDCVNIGQRTLRTETACVAMLAVINSILT